MRNSIVFLLLATVAGACVSPGPEIDPPPPGELVQSSLPRNTTPSVSNEDAATWRHDATSFALEVYHVAAASEGNLCFSPHSISLALAMTYAGARGTTKNEMAAALDFTLPDAALHAAFNSVDLALAAESDFELGVVNQVFGQQGFPIMADFLDVLAQNYGVGLRLLDFIRQAEPARVAINAWVEGVTKERIRELIPEGVITTDTRLVLANAIYFNADWKSPFGKSGTHSGSFHGLDGSALTVQRMSDIVHVRYADFAGFAAVDLPYEGGSVSMLVLVPDAGAFGDFEAALTRELLQEVTATLAPAAVQLTLPKFEQSVRLPLKQILWDLGMREAFDPWAADFSGMHAGGGLHVQDVLHKAFIKVDEEGTEAAAATASVVGTVSLPLYDVKLTVDRPFVYLIRHATTGAVLFVGRVVAP